MQHSNKRNKPLKCFSVLGKENTSMGETDNKNHEGISNLLDNGLIGEPIKRPSDGFKT